MPSTTGSRARSFTLTLSLISSLAALSCSSNPSRPFDQVAGAGGDAGNAGNAGTAGSVGGGGSDGSGGNAGGGSGGGGGTPFEPSFMLGADISSVQELIDRGVTFVDTDGATKDILTLLKAHGFNYVRLRAFVDPTALYGYANPTGHDIHRKAESYCDTAHTVEFGQQIKSAGMGFLLDLHYSDNWADPGKQIIPEAWRDAATIDDLASEVRSYTADVIDALVTAGARPDMVQIGNEITPGMLIHVPDANPEPDMWGNINRVQNAVNGSIENWANLATLLKAGIEGVKSVDPGIGIMLHVENSDDPEGAVWWVGKAREHGVEFDVLGLSCYTAWHGQPSTWQTTFTTLAASFPELSFVVAEYNPERTQVNQMMRDLPDNRGRGTFFWEPTQSGVWGAALFTGSNGALHAKTEDFAEFDAIRQNFGL